MKFLKKPKAPGQARGHTDHKLTMGLAHNIARHMFTPAMPYDQVWGCGTRWKCPFIGPKSVFDKPWCKGVGGVTWRHRGVFPIRLDRWKAQSVYFLNMHGRARPSHTGLERSDHHGLEVALVGDLKCHGAQLEHLKTLHRSVFLEAHNWWTVVDLGVHDL